MDIQEVMQWTDEQVLAKTGKHLDSLQQSILEGVWEHQNYEEIAKNNQLSYDHIKKEAWELWKILSDVIGEDIKKYNVRSILQRKAGSSIYNFGKYAQIISHINKGNINICDEKNQFLDDTQHRSHSPPNSPQNQNPSPIINITDAPELTNFYDRTSELSTLKQWIIARTRLITIYGLSGIGKSAIALKLIEQIQTEFDYIIWRSLSNTPTLSTLQTDLKQFLSQSQQTPLSTIIDYFRNSRCLVILDDIQNIFQTNQLAGEYLPGYEDYSKFFKQIATSSHQSSLILLSWEKPREIITLEAEKRPTQTLQLKGLEEQAEELLKEKGLTDEKKWLELINLYQRHPCWLNIIAATIQELFNGSVSLFLAEQNEIYLGDLIPLLETQLQRLSPSEKQVTYWLASLPQAVDISQQPDHSEISKSELWQAIQSLVRRSLVEKVQIGERSHFQINPIFKQYIQAKV